MGEESMCIVFLFLLNYHHVCEFLDTYVLVIIHNKTTSMKKNKKALLQGMYNLYTSVGTANG